MPHSNDQNAILAKFNKTAKLNTLPIMLEIESMVCGCNYGATSWTTRSEADEVKTILSLEPSSTLLEIGAGTGWPGLYIAKSTGCNVMLIDISYDSLLVAKERIREDQLASRCQVVAANGDCLPFARNSFDAVIHCDVLCCLPDKEKLLKTIRSLIKNNGLMLFSVISISPKLSQSDYILALEAAPLFVETSQPYASLLKQCGWELSYSKDLTKEYLSSVELQLLNEKKNKKKLELQIGAGETKALLTYRRATKNALEKGLIRRNIFVAQPS